MFKRQSLRCSSNHNKKWLSAPLTLIVLLGIVISVLIPHASIAQQTCGTAIQAQHDSTINLQFASGQADLWVIFTPDSAHHRLALFGNTDFSGFDTIEVFTGNCSNLTLNSLLTHSDSSVVIELNIWQIDYYIRVQRADTTGSENIWVQNTPPFSPATTTDPPFIYTYTITNPDLTGNVIYTWSINAGNGSATFGTTNIGNQVDVEIHSPATPYSSAFIELTVPAADGSDCEKSGIFRIYECCTADVDTVFNDATLSQNMLNNHARILLQVTTIIPSSIILSNMDVLMGPEASFIIQPGADLSVNLNSSATSNSIKQGCEVMWDGIYVIDPLASVEIENTTVKDAINAIVSKNGGEFSVNNCIFANN